METMIATDSFNVDVIREIIEKSAAFNRLSSSKLILDIFESCDGKKLDEMDAVIIKHNQLAVAAYINTNMMSIVDKSSIEYADILKMNGYTYVIDLDIQVDNTSSYLPYLIFGAFAFAVFVWTRPNDDDGNGPW